MQSLADLKYMIAELEEQLAEQGILIDHAPIQVDFMTPAHIDMRLESYLGHPYIFVETHGA